MTTNWETVKVKTGGILSGLAVRIGARAVVNTGGKLLRQIKRDNEMKQKGRAEVFELWRSGVSLQQAMRKLRQ